MINLTDLKKRDDLGEWLNQRGLVGTGVEVGSLTGEFARTIISKWKGEKLVMIDPWCRQPDDVYKEPVNNCDWGSAYHSCQVLYEQFHPRIRLMRDYSPGAAAYFQDGELSFCYIDANHDYEPVMSDLRAWCPKVMAGGLFGGHDYRTEVNDTQCCHVKEAIEEWCKTEKLPLPYITTYPGCYSWWLIK